MNEDRALPDVLVEAHSLGFFEDHEGHDFQPDDEFDSAVETTDWWRAWTGDPAAETPPFRVFGRDGAGGLAAVWARGPIVFLGSEGEIAVIARDMGDYLWLLANGVGPLERVDGIDRDPEPFPQLIELAQRYTGDTARPLEAIYETADAELPLLEALVKVATT
ncbi:SMI1/KNR4 family protein [Winogradskya humida]|uniref:SMI1/KNR4 family protein n=1 Tax=Winogradskya humida TaxID=113566 RepID=UPI0019413C3A|nr:SMI1/KNR4 family protein [Actinoplanes humidus]